MELLLDVPDRRVSIVAPVSDDFPRPLPRLQRDRLRVVAGGTARHDELERVAERIHEDVELGAEAAPGAPEPFGRLIPLWLGALAAQACARTTVASTITLRRSGSSATAWNSRSQTPNSPQRAKRL